MKISFSEHEFWFGGAVIDGVNQPYGPESEAELDLRQNQTPNQVMPLFLSTKGRWLWRSEGFSIRFCRGVIDCPDDVQLGAGETPTLRGAYRAAMEARFPFHPCKLHPLLFERPIYNTWIELTFHQTQEGVLRYARDILAHGLPPGVLMIDDGWSNTYGRWQFAKEKFPDPEEMLRELHSMGFLVMIWLCPFITPDTLEFRTLERAGLLVCNAENETHIVHWWNGWSALLDMENPGAADWLREQLAALQAMGVDGFKLDAGDSVYYPARGDSQSAAWAAFGERYSLNEFRVTAGAGGWSLMQRLCDKRPTWDDHGLSALVPDALLAGLTGHPYVCPDMIGGGEYQSFYEQSGFDGMLFVRWAQAASLMPVMQFSAAPWRCLSEGDYAAVRAAVSLREQLWPRLREAIEHCQAAGEPILRPLCYEFPGDGCETVMDEFMLGGGLLAAPVLSPGAAGRRVYLPKGVWRTQGRTIHSAGEAVDWVGEGLPLFERMEPAGS